MPDGERETHACHGSGLRLLRGREVGVGVDIGEPDQLATPTGAEQASKHDAAIAPEDDDESTVVETDRDTFREGSAVGRYPSFVSCPAGRTREILIRRGHHVAEVGGAQQVDKPEFPKDRGCTIHVLRLTALIIGAQSDARRRSYDREWAAHQTSSSAETQLENDVIGSP